MSASTSPAVMPRLSDRASFERVLQETTPALEQRYRNYCLAINEWNRNAFLPSDLYLDKTVLDLECGTGMYSAVLKLAGAGQVIGTDTFLNSIQGVPEAVAELEGVTLRPGSIQEMETELAGKFDLVFCCTSSEHVRDLAGMVYSASQVLKPGGYLFLNHDNYYQPVGHHDHGFLFLNPKTEKVEFQGVRCWEQREKCNASAEHRTLLKEKWSKLWTDELDGKLTPRDCNLCPYWKRSHPWAHLLYAQEFSTLFPTAIQYAGRPGAGLNKATPFQLRQFLYEAGFKLLRHDAFGLKNEVPPVLEEQFSRRDLLSFQITVLARKPE